MGGGLPSQNPRTKHSWQRAGTDTETKMASNSQRIEWWAQILTHKQGESFWEIWVGEWPNNVLAPHSW